MSITRRSFLKGMLGVGGAIIAGPAICKVENLMKIYVPPQELILGRGMTKSVIYAEEVAWLGGDYDGDTVSFITLPDRLPDANDEHMRKGLEAWRAEPNKAYIEFLRKYGNQDLTGRQVAVTRYPIVGRDSVRIIQL